MIAAIGVAVDSHSVFSGQAVNKQFDFFSPLRSQKGMIPLCERRSHDQMDWPFNSDPPNSFKVSWEKFLK